MQKVINSMIGLAALLVGGCATSAPQAKFTKEIAPTARVSTNDTVSIKVEPATGVSMVGYEKHRLTLRIEEKLNSKKALNTAVGEAKNYEVGVTITKYEKGSAFARAMLAGLGQIHVDGTVIVVLLPDREKVGEFTINKTFAWGGIYGASTTIEEAELGFADGVANALTGYKEPPPKSPKKR